MFTTEFEMSKKFENYLKQTFGNAYLKEQTGLFGVPDFIVYSKKSDGNVSFFSFELKLKNWQQALKQAFKYKSFSNISYVVIERSGRKAALTNLEVFQKYNIGLASFDKSNKLDIIFKPDIDSPYSEELVNKMNELVHTSRKQSKNLDVLYT